MRPVQLNSSVQSVLPIRSLRPQPAGVIGQPKLRDADDGVMFGGRGRTRLILTTLFLAAVGVVGVHHVRNRHAAQQAAKPQVEFAAQPPHVQEPTVTALITKPGQAEPIASILYNAERDTLDVFAGNGKTDGQWDPKKYKGEVNAQGMVFPILGVDNRTGMMAMSSNPVYMLDPNGFFRAIGGEKKPAGQPKTMVSLRLGEVDDVGTVHRISRIIVRPSVPADPTSDTVVQIGPTDVAGSIQRTDGRPLDQAYKAAAAYAALVVDPNYQNPFLRPGRLEDIPNVERHTFK